MSTKALLIASLLMMSILGAYLYLNVRALRGGSELAELRLDPLRVQGMAGTAQQTVYTLNFEQVKALLPGLNQSDRLQATPMDALAPIGVQSLTVFRFTEPPLQIELAGALDGRLVFRCADWEGGRWQVEQRASTAAEALRNAYDE
ncbi:MAG: hypothetical protein KDK78_03895 [Chlamydiia bacterium]|nr:hypothetical protein [Chlamydiia bacterium]